VRVLCAADLHLHDWPGLAPVDRLADQDAVLGQIVELTADRDVDAVLLAGDIFHRPHPTPRVLDVFDRFVRRLVKVGPLDVVAICGNASHDIVNAEEYAALELFDDLITVARGPRVINVRGAAIACLPSVPVSTLVAARGGGDRDEVNQDAALLLLETARELRAQIPDGTPAVLAAHWSVSGAAFPNGLPVDAAREPVLPLGELERLDYDAIVLGHIHRYQRLATIADDPICPLFYCGSPLPLDFGEAGYPHGVVILDVGGDALVDEFVPLESRPFVTLDADITGDTETTGLAYLDVGAAWNDEMAGGAIVRARIRATEQQWRRVDAHAIQSGLLDSGAARVVIQPDIVREDRARVEGLDEAVTELDAVGLYIDAQQIDEGRGEQLRDLTTSYLEASAA
jgi:exonuclease SbcD